MIKGLGVRGECGGEIEMMLVVRLMGMDEVFM
jgi:hypothetical protein